MGRTRRKLLPDPWEVYRKRERNGRNQDWFKYEKNTKNVDTQLLYSRYDKKQKSEKHDDILFDDFPSVLVGYMMAFLSFVDLLALSSVSKSSKFQKHVKFCIMNAKELGVREYPQEKDIQLAAVKYCKNLRKLIVPERHGFFYGALDQLLVPEKCKKLEHIELFWCTNQPEAETLVNLLESKCLPELRILKLRSGYSPGYYQPEPQYSRYSQILSSLENYANFTSLELRSIPINSEISTQFVKSIPKLQNLTNLAVEIMPNILIHLPQLSKLSSLKLTILKNSDTFSDEIKDDFPQLCSLTLGSFEHEDSSKILEQILHRTSNLTRLDFRRFIVNRQTCDLGFSEASKFITKNEATLAKLSLDAQIDDYFSDTNYFPNLTELRCRLLKGRFCRLVCAPNIAQMFALCDMPNRINAEVNTLEEYVPQLNVLELDTYFSSPLQNLNALVYDRSLLANLTHIKLVGSFYKDYPKILGVVFQLRALRKSLVVELQDNHQY